MVIPWRPGGDEHRVANFEFLREAYSGAGIEVIVADDGREPGEPFNRSAAYNRGMAQTDADVIVWCEADCLIPVWQLEAGAQVAAEGLGLVLPYTDRVELTQAATARLRALPGAFSLTAEDIEAHYPDGRSIGQCGITSRATMAAIGGAWDEGFSGWGWDDNAMFHIFGMLAGPPAWVACDDGPSVGLHMWHPPAYRQPSPEAAAQTEANRVRYEALLAEYDPNRVRAMLGPSERMDA
jgi:hypothetical protein